MYTSITFSSVSLPNSSTRRGGRPSHCGGSYSSSDRAICAYIGWGSELEHFNWNIAYDISSGGIVSLHKDHLRMINGFSNDFKGWGGEDNDLGQRLRINNLLDLD